MDLNNRISSFVKLGELLPKLIQSSLPDEAHNANNWFTKSEMVRALNSWSKLLTADYLMRWIAPYRISSVPSNREILVITAGNLPLVGFHDFLSVLILGYRFIGKLSSRDDVLLTALAKELVKIEPGFKELIDLQGKNQSPDAVIATGSNNSSRYFQLEYGNIPHIIRKNRTSAAVIDANETGTDLKNLASDILYYYGLGCRSVSHLFLPSGYSFENLLFNLLSFNQVDPCSLYSDNQRFQKARLSMLNTIWIDAGSTLLVEDENLHSPISVVHYSYYNDSTLLFNGLKNRADEIQCLVGNKHLSPDLIPFGTAQKPDLWDYADNVDTLEFLINI